MKQRDKKLAIEFLDLIRPAVGIREPIDITDIEATAMNNTEIAGYNVLAKLLGIEGIR